MLFNKHVQAVYYLMKLLWSHFGSNEMLTEKYTIIKILFYFLNLNSYSNIGLNYTPSDWSSTVEFMHRLTEITSKQLACNRLSEAFCFIKIWFYS